MLARARDDAERVLRSAGRLADWTVGGKVFKQTEYGVQGIALKMYYRLLVVYALLDHNAL